MSRPRRNWPKRKWPPCSVMKTESKSTKMMCPQPRRRLRRNRYKDGTIEFIWCMDIYIYIYIYVYVSASAQLVKAQVASVFGKKDEDVPPAEKAATEQVSR